MIMAANSETKIMWELAILKDQTPLLSLGNLPMLLNRMKQNKFAFHLEMTEGKRHGGMLPLSLRDACAKGGNTMYCLCVTSMILENEKARFRNYPLEGK